ncbi:MULTISPECIES: DUF2835 family protein [unclassified Arsukibacterium]|uniref:DUF2835 family protein n=1 Tax=unclassified Arsukibacterium TaxID=2635278 RepID=UPI000C6AE891|nr:MULTISPECIES: DUF2835 family protein [unclassified Arsukibacterium]MAA94013.1 hypothetical protein [Rheinheimera sp.]MBM33386.1 hypothetical protein [Rheinheimera sp.]HAW92535.1 DUF2835 domain-containing protein [Candidatus Azambacteria bacterium]|tara:strand:- start:2974 stop:3198 length:225 start_codon:yes stop_codon:yes gene_type:complete
MKRQFLFNAFLARDKCLLYYQGSLRYVVVTADSGERIQLGLKHFQPFFSDLGLRGRFRLSLTQSGAFERLEKIN